MDKNLKLKIEKLLHERGIRMEVGGCGCCGSPWISFEVDGVMICKDKDEANFDMFENIEDPAYLGEKD